MLDDLKCFINVFHTCIWLFFKIRNFTDKNKGLLFFQKYHLTKKKKIEYQQLFNNENMLSFTIGQVFVPNIYNPIQKA